MKNLRKPTFRKVITAFFLINFLSSIFLPNYAFALTGGPHQIEYTSYEEPGATDMVNLLTGDFTYNLPILDIPGPEGSFSLPLSYHAGIGLEQEASWVGLGWTMNPGAIVRNINEFPDDARGEAHSVTVQDLNVIKGWDSNLGLLRLGWNNQVGHYGSVSLPIPGTGVSVNAAWGGGQLQSVGISGYGVSVGSNGVNFDPVSFMLSVSRISADKAISTLDKTTQESIDKARSIGNTAMLLKSTVFMGGDAPSLPNAGVWKQSKRVRQKLFRKEYKIWLNHTRTEDMYGTLYSGDQNLYTQYNFDIAIRTNGVTNAPIQSFTKSSSIGNKGSVSDINYQIEDGKEYHESNNPAVLAYDNYQVSAAGISGSISPYRLDVGSVSMPREISNNHYRLAPVKWVDYKVPFVYEGESGNNYYHHVGSASSVSAPTPYFGISHTVGNTTPQYNSLLTLNLNDVVLKNDRVRSDVNESKKIPVGSHIEWLTNDEIKATQTYGNGFIDFLPGGATSKRTSFRTDCSLDALTTPSTYNIPQNYLSVTIPVSASAFQALDPGDPIEIHGVEFITYEDYENGTNGYSFQILNLEVESKSSNNGYKITLKSDPRLYGYNNWLSYYIKYYSVPPTGSTIGGYVITSKDGTNYHFALPVYDYDNRTEVIDVTSDLKKSIMTRNQPFANTWLLTAITYSDFIDRNNNGLADDADWGGWIKFNYGSYEDTYHWRSPFAGFKNDPSNKTKSFSEGKKQLYYLNSIETRSHIALFLKSIRQDGLSLNSKAPLRLDEVVLLAKEHYKKLILPVGSGGFGTTDFTNEIDNICYYHQYQSSTRSYINSNALKRIKFTYTYDLCQGLPIENSTAGGKLTLSKVSFISKGADDNIITPDFKFQYGSNPAFGEHKWDGWGLYHSSGSQTNHTTNQVPGFYNAWTLSKITTPLGAEIDIYLERDVFNSISGEPVKQPAISFLNTNVNKTYLGPSSLGQIDNVNHNGTIKAGDNVILQGGASFLCPGTNYYQPRSFNAVFTVYSVSGNSIHLNTDFMGTGCTPSYGTQINFEYIQGTIQKTNYDFIGGDIRVHSIVTTDEFGSQNKIRYLYSKPDGTSSGVMGKQNPYAKFDGFDFEDNPEMPATPVMYGTVSVLNGKLSSDMDYHTKTVYEFETPHKNMISYQPPSTIPPYEIQYDDLGYLRNLLSFHEHIIHNHSGKIGGLKSIKVYDKQNSLKSSKSMTYRNDLANDMGKQNQGVYTQGVIMADRILHNGIFHNKVSRTTLLRYSYNLDEVVDSKDGLTSKSKNTKWDFITGDVLENVETSPMGIMVKSVTVPAYKITPVYAEFGPKALSPSNKNMLSQVAEEYTYLLDANGAEVGLLGASVQTWKKDWNNYRIYSGGTYTQGPEGDQVWRKGAAYVWRGDYNRLQTDGSQSFSTSDKFNFASGSSNPGWEYIGEPLRYDHYSMTLESKDRNNIYTSSKMGYDNKVKILSASNAEYTEVAFSSAEDYDAITGHFGGEVALKSSGGNASVIKKSTGGDSHTGDCAIQLSSGYGFVFKPTGLKPNQKYRASVWTKSTNGRIYYKLNGGGEVLSPAPTTLTKAGNWYLINFEVPIGASFTSLEVGVKSASGTVQFDDFRFQPVDASMVCYVYNPLTHELSGTNLEYSEYVLDNDNLYTRYLYNDKGQLNKTFRESIKYNGEKLVSESTSDYRRFYINQ